MVFVDFLEKPEPLLWIGAHPWLEYETLLSARQEDQSRPQ
jgi:hypothetical protein